MVCYAIMCYANVYANWGYIFPVPCSPFFLFFVFHSRSPFPVPRSHFSVPCSPFPVVRSPFPVLSFGNIPLKSTYFCHIWLGIASRASFLAANTKRFVVTSRHFTSSFPGSLFFPSSSFLGRGYCLERFAKCLSFIYPLYLMIAIKFPVI